MRNIFRRQTETAAPTLRDRAADLRASLRTTPTASVAMLASDSDEDADAELIRLGHLFEAARAREIAACEACNAAGREADRLMPPRPACLIYRASDNSLHVHQEMMMAEALAGREVRMQDIEWLRRKMPMRHEVLRPIREGERAHMDHPGRRFDIVPHPEAQARAEEIVTAWDAWYAAKTRIYEKHVTEALENAADEAGRAVVALAEQIAGLPAHTAAGFRVKLRALTHYRREILLAEIPAEPDPDQILTHSLWRDVQGDTEVVPAPKARPADLLAAAGLSLEALPIFDLSAILDAAEILSEVAAALTCQPRHMTNGSFNGAGILIENTAFALNNAIDAVARELRSRTPANRSEQAERLGALARFTIHNDHDNETAALARELLAMVER